MDADHREKKPARGDAVGIIVKTSSGSERRPRAVAFVWGRQVSAAPSLPYGRWKPALTAA